MAWTQKEVKIVDISPKYVEWFHHLPRLKGDRDFESPSGRKRVAWLNGLLRTDQFHSPKWAIAHLDGKVYRVDGGHSSKMLLQTDGVFPPDLQAVLQIFDCDTERDLVDLYTIFDSKRSARTAADKAKAHAALETGLADIRPTWILKCVAGVLCHRNGGITRKMSDEANMQVIHDEPRFIGWAVEYVKTRWLSRSGVVACMFRSYLASKRIATEFWNFVVEESHPKPRNATRTLARFLQEVASTKNADGWDPRALYVKSIHAWNAWQRGETTALMYFKNAEVPKLYLVSGKSAKSY